MRISWHPPTRAEIPSCNRCTADYRYGACRSVSNSERIAIVQAAKTTFRQLIEGTKQFVIPVFQRDYAWERENWQQLWHDITRAASKSGERGHFVGIIVHVPDQTVASRPTYQVIDGQQRLTTLTILCAALRDHIRSNDLAGQGLPNAKHVDAFISNNAPQSDGFRYKLRLRRADDDTLRVVVDGENFAEMRSGKSERIAGAYEYFAGMLNGPAANLPAVYNGLSRLRIVEISLDRSIDNPQTVFESINSTGVRLSQGDLVRNYLLMGLQEAEQIRMYQDYWQKIEDAFRGTDGVIDNTALNLFLRDYIALKQKFTQESQIPRIYEEFKKYRNGKAASIILEDLLTDMMRFAGYYAEWNGRRQTRSAPLTTAMRNLRQQGNTTGLLVMRLYDCHEQETLSEADFIRGLCFIESFLVRHVVVGHHQIRGYWWIFAGMAVDIQDDDPSGSLRATLAKDRGKSGFWTFPTDEAFDQALRQGEIYHTRICKNLLDRLENDGQREPSPVNTYTIEHIMPQSLTNDWRMMLGDDSEQIHADWLHQLGNLTLTAHNPEYSNRSFSEKKTCDGGFNESAVRLNQFVREQSEWTVAQMEERGTLLAKRALKIWPHP